MYFKIVSFDGVALQADVNRHDSMGRHALHMAAEAGSVASVQFLINDAAVNVNLQTTVACNTSLHFAAKVRYDMRCYFNIRSKADMSQLNLPHGNNN